MDFSYFYRHKNQIKLFELYVTNLPKTVYQQHLAAFFSRWAAVKFVKIFVSRYEGFNSALVRFFYFHQMMTAFENSYRAQIGGHQIQISFSKHAAIVCNNCFKIGHLKKACKSYNPSPTIIRTKNRPMYSREKCRQQINKSFSGLNRIKIQGNNLNHSCVDILCSREKPGIILQRRDKSKKSKINNFKHSDQLAENSLAETSYEVDIKNNNMFPDQIEFVQISKANKDVGDGLISFEEESRLGDLWSSGFFDGELDFVEIAQPSIKKRY